MGKKVAHKIMVKLITVYLRNDKWAPQQGSCFFWNVEDAFKAVQKIFDTYLNDPSSMTFYLQIH